MAWTLTGDVERFAGTAGTFLRSHPIEHTVLLTVVGRLRRQDIHAYGPDDPAFGWWQSPAGEVAGVLLHTPPHPVMFSLIPAEAVAGAVAALAGRPLPGANLPVGIAGAFAAGWRRQTGATTTEGRRSRLYRLRGLTPPPAPAGMARTATPDDRELLLRWLTAFHDEIGEPARDLGPQADDWLAAGATTLWTNGGEPVSMASRTPA